MPDPIDRDEAEEVTAEIDVLGEKRNDVFDPDPDGEDEGPIYGDGEGEGEL